MMLRKMAQKHWNLCIAKGWIKPYRKGWAFTTVGAFAAIVICGPMIHRMTNYVQLNIDDQPQTSMPFRFSLKYTGLREPIQRGSIIWFETPEFDLRFHHGAVKSIAGMPGDHFVISKKGVFINGERKGSLAVENLAVLGRAPESYFRDEIVPNGHYIVMGTNRLSYDSRYWGYLSEDQIKGTIQPIF